MAPSRLIYVITVELQILIINCLEMSLVMMVKIQWQHAQHGASPGDTSGKEPAC